MRCPYIMGSRYVKGHEFYGRERLLDHILHGPDGCIWVLGNRRVGKTSLLRQLEHLAQGDETCVVIYFNLEGITNVEDLSLILYDDLEYMAEDLVPLGLDVSNLQNRSAFEILRALVRQAERTGCYLLLLLDEAEALITIATSAPKALSSLRREFQRSDSVKVVLAATKRLIKLNRIAADTSSFLGAFACYYITGLSNKAAESLVCQTQNSRGPIGVHPYQLGQILHVTNNHPFLIQRLCGSLFQDTGTLGEFVPEDLTVDDLLAQFLQIDYDHLSSYDRLVLAHIIEEALDLAALQSATHLSELRLRSVLDGLEKLGYIRRIDGRFLPGNHFLHLWLRMGRADEDRGAVSNVDNLEVLEASQRGEQGQFERRRDDMESSELTQWAMGVLTAASTFLFGQVGEILKERHEARRAAREAEEEAVPVEAPAEPEDVEAEAPELAVEAEEPPTMAPIAVPPEEELPELASTEYIASMVQELEREARLSGLRMTLRGIESLMKQLEDHKETINLYREEAAGGLTLDDRVIARRRIAAQQEEVTEKALEMKALLEEVYGHELPAGWLEE